MKSAVVFTFTLLLSLSVAQAEMSNVESTRLLAEQDDPYSQLYLAYMYEHGKGLPVDMEQAYSWYRKAADHGMPAGQHSLGLMYAEGIVVPQDDLAAYIFFYMAAVQSHEGASKKRDEMAARLNAEQLDRGQKLAIACVESRYTECPLQ